MGSLIGVMKQKAAQRGLTLEQYQAKLAAGFRWCCICQDWVEARFFDHDRTRADGLAGKCRPCSRTMPSQTFRLRDPVKERARGRVNVLVARRLIPSPNDLACSGCGHKGDDKRHEYHHHKGYEGEAAIDVIPLCTTCHAEEGRSSGA